MAFSIFPSLRFWWTLSKHLKWVMSAPLLDTDSLAVTEVGHMFRFTCDWGKGL